LFPWTDGFEREEKGQSRGQRAVQEREGRRGKRGP
jgi:hypothetical protein